jgi:ribonuclease HII
MNWYRENDIPIDDSAGIDEAGRGPLAGPVVAACVRISSAAARELRDKGPTVRDSKQLSAVQRRKITDWMKLQSAENLQYAVGIAEVEEIDTLNILRATMLAMERAYDSSGVSVRYVLVDGNRLPSLKNADVRGIVKGDVKILSVSLASVAAKEYRDGLMRKLAEEYPGYGWETNVGYGSAEHIAAISKYGVTPCHRKTFAPMAGMHKKCLELTF